MFMHCRIAMIPCTGHRLPVEPFLVAAKMGSHFDHQLAKELNPDVMIWMFSSSRSQGWVEIESVIFVAHQ